MAHGILGLYAVVAVYPLWLMAISALKSTPEILFRPFALPSQLYWENFAVLWRQGQFGRYLVNSGFVSVTSVALVLACASLAGYALGRYTFRANAALSLYFLAGIMVPIRLGVLPLFLLMRDLGLIDTPWALILTYAASGLPFSVFLLSGFFRQLPKELEYAARVDGCSDWAIFWRVMLPLVRPALATVALFNFVPVWNDFFFPLIFIRSDAWKTIPLGLALFIGQYETNWGALFAGMLTSSAPLLLAYLAMSRQFISGLTAGALKG